MVDVYALLEDAAKFLIRDDTHLHLRFSVALIGQLGFDEYPFRGQRIDRLTGRLSHHQPVTKY